MKKRSKRIIGGVLLVGAAGWLMKMGYDSMTEAQDMEAKRKAAELSNVIAACDTRECVQRAQAAAEGITYEQWQERWQDEYEAHWAGKEQEIRDMREEYWPHL